MVCGCCTFCGLTHTTWRSGHWIFESLSITTTLGLCLDPLSRSRTLLAVLNYGHRTWSATSWLAPRLPDVDDSRDGGCAAQCGVAREQAAKEAEKHAQLLAEQDKRHKEQMQAILDRLQPAVPPLRLQHHPDKLLASHLSQLQDHPRAPQLSPR